MTVATKTQLDLSTGKTIPFTIVESASGRLTKKMFIGASGSLEKDGATLLSTGFVRVVTVQNMHELEQRLNALEPEQAVTFGLPKHGLGSITPAPLMSKKLFEQHGRPENVVTRTRENFEFSAGGAILCLDHDPKTNGEALTQTELRAALIQAVPALKKMPTLQRVSSSSCLSTGSGQQLAGILGQRIYIFVKSGLELPEITEAIHQRLWLAGFGRIDISKNGQLLERSLIDRSVVTPEHLDYAASPVLCDGLFRNTPPPLIFESDQRLGLDEVALTSSEFMKYKSLVAVEKSKMNDVSEQIRTSWAKSHARRIATNGTRFDEIERAYLLASENPAGGPTPLHGCFELVTDLGERVSVESVLRSPEKWHETTFKDPIEPDYDGGRTVAKLYFRNEFGTPLKQPVIHSFAHGGIKYTLGTTKNVTKHDVPYAPEDLPSIVCNVQKALLEDTSRGHIFNRGGFLSYVEEGVPTSVSELREARAAGTKSKRLNVRQFTLTGIKLRTMGSIAFQKIGKSTNHPIACPNDVAQALLDQPNFAEPLTGILEVATITPDGIVLDQEGYDAQTGLFVAIDENLANSVPKTATRDDALQAINYLEKEFLAGFPFASEIDRACAISLLLTGFARRFLRSSPGFMISATTQASGKSALVESVFYVLTGRTAPASSWSSDQDEMRKFILAVLLEGHSGICFDNLPFGCRVDGDELAKLLTQEVYSARILGSNKSAQVGTNILVTLTGNQLIAVNDMPSRLIPIKLVPNVENPEQISHRRSNLQRWICENRRKIVEAVNTVFVAWQQSGEKASQQIGASRFPDWDDAVRRPMIWIGLPDVAESFEKNRTEDPARELRGELLEAWYAYFGGRWVDLRELQQLLVFDNLRSEPDLSRVRAIRESIEELCGKSEPTARHIGNHFRFFKDAIFGNFRLTQKTPGTETSKRARPWRVEQVPTDMSLQK